MVHASFYCANPQEDNPVCGLRVQDLTIQEFKNQCSLGAQEDFFASMRFPQKNYFKMNDGKCKSSYTLSELQEVINKETDNLNRPIVIGKITEKYGRA